jgi:hypothetical protein
MTLPHGNRAMAFYKFVKQAKPLRKFRQMKEFFFIIHNKKSV